MCYIWIWFGIWGGIYRNWGIRIWRFWNWILRIQGLWLLMCIVLLCFCRRVGWGRFLLMLVWIGLGLIMLILLCRRWVSLQGGWGFLIWFWMIRFFCGKRDIIYVIWMFLKEFRNLLTGKRCCIQEDLELIIIESRYKLFWWLSTKWLKLI